MKKSIILSAFALVALLFMNFNQVSETELNPQDDKYKVPEDIQQIIDKSCKGCHVSDSKDMKAKTKLNWEKMYGKYKTHKVVGKLMKIEEELKKGDMPPKKFVAKYPDRNISPEDSKKLQAWVKEMAAKLSE